MLVKCPHCRRQIDLPELNKLSLSHLNCSKCSRDIRWQRTINGTYIVAAIFPSNGPPMQGYQPPAVNPWDNQGITISPGFQADRPFYGMPAKITIADFEPTNDYLLRRYRDELAEAVKAEDYETCAILRDRIAELQ